MGMGLDMKPAALEAEVEPKVRPEMFEPAWFDFVMSHFQPDELVEDKKTKKKCPRVHAMWRVAEQLLGMIEYDCDIVKAPGQNDRSASVKAVVVIHPHASVTLPAGKYAGAAEGCEANIGDGFDKYVLAVTETRALGRALKKALRLHKTIAAEEMDFQDWSDTAAEDRITQTQLGVIDKAASTANVNVRKFIQAEAAKKSLNLLMFLPKSFGAHLAKTITQYQGKGQAPPELSGYSSDWRPRS